MAVRVTVQVCMQRLAFTSDSGLTNYGHKGQQYMGIVRYDGAKVILFIITAAEFCFEALSRK